MPGPFRFTFLLLGACSAQGGGEHAAGPAVRDSAGIQIVENSAPRWAEGKGWAVVDSPLVDIGGQAGDAAYDLTQVAGMLILPGDRLAVVVGGAHQVRFYDREGVHLATAGRRGNGPGEFQGIAGIWPVPGDSVLVADMMLARLTVLSDSGQFGRTFTLGQAGVNLPSGGRFTFGIPSGAFPDGRVLAYQQAFRVNDATKGAYRDSADYLVYSPTGTVADTIGRFPGIEMEQVTMSFGTQSFSAPSPVPLGKTTSAVLAGDRLLLTMNHAWEIEQYDVAGTLERIIRLRVEPRPITPEDVTAHREETRQAVEEQPMLRGMPAQIKKQMLDRVQQAHYPETFPFIVSMLVGTDGTIWVREQTTPGDEQQVYAVLDASGALLGRVTFPDRFAPMYFTGDKVAGVWKDAEDVEHARIYALRKP